MSEHPKVGAYVLESLTTGMYTQPLDAVREYVQNSMDSIQKAEQEGVLSEMEGRIEIELSRSGRRFKIRDNGMGVPADDAPSRLLNIGMSSKDIGKNAGFRGIGRLAGIAYCNRLTFRASARGEDRISEVSIDCGKLRAALAPSNRQVEELADVLSKHTTVEVCKGPKADHFFEVALEGVGAEDNEFLDALTLEDYLCQVAPVPFDNQMFLFAPKITKWLKERGIYLPQCHIVIRDNGNSRQVLKPYRNKYKANSKNGELSIDIQDVVPFLDEGKEPAYWGWYAQAQVVGAVEEDKVAGLRLRHHNISLGGADRIGDIFASISDSGQYRRFNRYYLGEIHVLSDVVIPNARRDGFEESVTWRAIKRELTELAKTLKARAYSESDARNKSPEVLVQKANKTAEDVTAKLQRGLASSEEAQTLAQRVGDNLKRMQQTAETEHGKSSKALSAKIKQLTSLKQEIESGNHYATSKLPSSLSRKERKMIQQAMEIAHRELGQCSCKDWEKCYTKVHDAIMKELKAGAKE